MSTTRGRSRSIYLDAETTSALDAYEDRLPEKVSAICRRAILAEIARVKWDGMIRRAVAQEQQR